MRSAAVHSLVWGFSVAKRLESLAPSQQLDARMPDRDDVLDVLELAIEKGLRD